MFFRMNNDETIDKITILSTKFKYIKDFCFNNIFINYVKTYRHKKIVRRVIMRHFYELNLSEESLNEICDVSKEFDIKVQNYNDVIIINSDYNDSAYQVMINEAYSNKILSHKEQLELIKKIHKGDEKARLYLFNHSLRLPIFVVLALIGSYSEDKEDMLSIGYIALNEAIDSFDINKNKTFANYAIKCIKNKELTYIKMNIIPRLYRNKFTLFNKIPFKIIALIFNNYLDWQFVKSTLELYLKDNVYRKQKTIDYILNSFVEFKSIDDCYNELEGTPLREEDPRNSDDMLFSEAFIKLREDIELICNENLPNERKEAFYYLKGLNDYPKLGFNEVCKKYNLTRNQLLGTEAKINKLLESKQYSFMRNDWYEYLNIKERNYERL